MAVRSGSPRVAVLAAALVITGSFAAGAAPTARAAVPGANGRVAWQRNTDAGSHVWTMRPDGTAKTDLGAGEHPQWSPDGTKLLLSGFSGTGITTTDANGGNPIQLLDHGARAVWAPDGTRIAFDHYDNQAGNYDLYVMDADGTNVVNITNDPAEDIEPSWSPDGTRIAFRSNRGGPTDVWTVDTTGADPKDLGAGSDPDWSPDGAKIAFASAGIWVMNADGTGRTHLTTTSDMMPAWSPDGARIVVTSNRDANAELYSIAANGTNPVRLTNDHTGATYPEDWWASWQPTAFALSPAAVSFGNGVVGTPSAPKTVTLVAGAAPISVTSVQVAGSNAADFVIATDMCSGVVLAAHASCTATVRFDAEATGVRSASLDFTGAAPLGTASVALTGFGRLFLWGTPHAATPSYTWNDGRALASTASGSTTYLHVPSVTDRVNGAWVTDSGPRAGVYYLRSSNGGSTWTTPRRLNPTTQHGSRATISSSGTYVYAAWVSTTKWVHYSPTAPRVLYFRRNTYHGSSTHWSSTVRLSSLSGRVDWPTIAASGSYVYVAYTDSSTGAIRVAISSNRGATWHTVTIGTTAKSTTSGRLGIPRVAASGSTVAVTWLSSSTNSVKLRASTSYGSTWGTTTSIAASTSAPPDVAVAGSRIAVAWSTATINVRVSTAGTWGSVRTLPPTDGYAVDNPFGPALALLGSHGVGVVYTTCIADCTFSDSSVFSRSDLIWRQSTDDGATWAPDDVVSASTSTTHRSNDTPSLVWKTAKRPFVLWNGWTEETNYYRMYVRAGA